MPDHAQQHVTSSSASHLKFPSPIDAIWIVAIWTIPIFISPRPTEASDHRFLLAIALAPCITITLIILLNIAKTLYSHWSESPVRQGRPLIHAFIAIVLFALLIIQILLAYLTLGMLFNIVSNSEDIQHINTEYATLMYISISLSFFSLFCFCSPY